MRSGPRPRWVESRWPAGPPTLSALPGVIMTLQGATDRLYVVERGVRDDRARLAFREGQCHGLALALWRRTGWPLVAIENDGLCEHVTVRHPHGHLVDILGGHPGGLSESAGTVELDVEASYIDELVANRNWSAPDLEAADAWVEGVLERAAGPPDEPPGGFAKYGPIGNGYELRLEWRGQAYMDAFVRAPALSKQWVPIDRIFIPRDPATRRHRIDFTRTEFERLAPMLASEFEQPTRRTWTTADSSMARNLRSARS